MIIAIEIRRGGPNQRGGDIRITTARGWVRGALYIDPPPRMSHIGLWRTRYHGLRGVNLRVKVWRGYVTALVHARRF